MSKISLSRKLYGLAAIPLLLGIVVSGLLVHQLQLAYHATDQILSQSVRQQSVARDMRYAFKRQVQEWKDTLLRGHNPEDFKKYSANFHTWFKNTQDMSATLQSLVTDPQVHKLISQFQAAYATMGQKYGEDLATFEASGGRDPFAADTQVRGIDRPPTVVLDHIVKLLTERYASDEAALRAATQRQRLETELLVAVGAAAALLIALFVVLFARGLSRSLREITDSLDRASQHTVESSKQVSDSSQSLAQGASEQAASLEETSSTLEEISGMTQRTSENVEQAERIAVETQGLTRKGSETMGRMNTAIDAIKDSADQTAKIIKTIDEIAFQTNLLALNAAVEAARAGDAGRGFAVVAEEVRNLATRSAAAAKDTNQLIEASQQRAEHGVSLSSEVAQVLAEISGSVDQVNTLLSDVTRASQEQSTGISQITTAVNAMDQVVQNSAALAEEAASSSQELAAQSENLRRVVDTLTNIVQGVASRDEARPQATPEQPQRVSMAPHMPVVAPPRLAVPAPQAQGLKLRQKLEQELVAQGTTPLPAFSGLAESDFRDMA